MLIQSIAPFHTLPGSPPRVDNRTVGEMLLPAVLHLHNETVAVLVLAVQVETDEFVLLADFLFLLAFFILVVVYKFSLRKDTTAKM